ncbi:MAG TPA: hypothetical protein VLA43_07565 [Longimicrobiales bacterium]|nr:hypothetical protein [Longimicrobiales bacterium]
MSAAELGRAGILALGFLMILAGAEAWHRLRGPRVELTRKLVHLASGVPVLAFPWLFESPWTVALLSACIAGVLAIGGRTGMLGSVHGVERRSVGELLYPLAIVLLFALGHQQPVFYFTSVLVLILADPAAALVGLSYGRTKYSVEDHWRSAEGSAVFFLTTFLAVHLPLLLMGGVDPPHAVLVALLVAMVVTLLEAVSLHGSDNLTIPLSAFILLDHLTARPLAVVTGHVVALLGSLGFLWILSRRTGLLRLSGILTTTLFFYAIFVLAGPWWVIPPAISAVAITVARRRLDPSKPMPDAEFQVVAIGYTAIPSLVIALAHYFAPAISSPAWPTEPTAFAAVYAGAVAGHLGIMCALLRHPFGPEWDRRLPPGKLLRSVVQSVVLLGPAALWMTGALSLDSLWIAAAVAMVCAGAYWVVRSATRWPSEIPWNYRLQAACVTAVSLAGLLLLARTGA